MFELETQTKARMTDVRVLSQKNREPDTDPGAKLCFAATLANEILSTLDGQLKSTLFYRNGAIQKTQPGLDGVDVVSDLPNLTGIGKAVGKMAWHDSGSGYSLAFDLGIGSQPLRVNDCTVGDIRVEPKEGGTVVIKFNVESSDVSEAAFGKLAKQKSREVLITLLKPTVATETQRDLEDTSKTPARAPKPLRVKGKEVGTKVASIAQADALDVSPKPDGWPFKEGEGPDATDAFIAGQTQGSVQ